MARRQPSVVIELGRQRLRAVLTSTSGRRVEVRRVLDVEIPHDVLAMDGSVAATGATVAEGLDRRGAQRSLSAWLERTLDDGGIPRGPVLLALPREALVIRRLELPTVDRHELPDMARLAIRRDLPLDGGEAAMDFVELHAPRQGPSEPVPGATTAAPQSAQRGAQHGGAQSDRDIRAEARSSRDSTMVMAVAMLRRTLDDACSTLAAVGRPVASASARMLGSAALISAADPEAVRGEGAVVVDARQDGVEFLVLDRGGEITFSRGALWRPERDAERRGRDSPQRAEGAEGGVPRDVQQAGQRPSDAPSSRESVLVEAITAEMRRSWVAYRMALSPMTATAGSASGATAVSGSVFLLAEPGLREALRSAVWAAIGLEPAADHRNGGVLSGVDPGACAPLAGLQLSGCARIDLLNPRRSPDRAARTRQVLIGAAGVLILAGLLGFTLGRREADAVAARREDIATKARGALAEGWRLRRDEDKLRHIAQWTRPDENWLEDFISIKQLLPGPGEVVLDKVDATLEFSGVKWERPRSANSGGGAAAGSAAEGTAPRWQSAAEVRIVLEGEARTRAIADALREKFIADSRFSTTTSGSDARGGERLPYPFGFLLRAQRSDVAPPPSSP